MENVNGVTEALNGLTVKEDGSKPDKRQGNGERRHYRKGNNLNRGRNPDQQPQKEIPSKKNEHCRKFLENRCQLDGQCRYIHDETVCKVYFKYEKCDVSNCGRRHLSIKDLREDAAEVAKNMSHRTNGEQPRSRRDGREQQRQENNNQSNHNHTKKKREQRPKKARNTECFEPSHTPADMRVLFASGHEEQYPRPMTTRDVVIVPGLYDEENRRGGRIYDRLLQELEASAENNPRMWKLWHGDSHVIADDHVSWKSMSPTFNLIVERIRSYFNMDIKATRLNWYRDTTDWKPYHHDAAAVKKDKAQTQNVTVSVSFGVEREAAFEHAQTYTTVSFPACDGSAYVFCKDVNIDWKHGIPQLSPELQTMEGRISIIAWGWIDQVPVNKATIKHY